MEVWRIIPGYNDYQVSDTGRVKSFKNNNPKILGHSIDGGGYKTSMLYSNNKPKRFKNHKLIAMSFLGHKPGSDGLIVDHIDNDKMNNKLPNLQLITVTREQPLEIWIFRRYNRWKIEKIREFEEDSEGWHSYRAHLCGIPGDETDVKFHERITN